MTCAGTNRPLIFSRITAKAHGNTLEAPCHSKWALLCEHMTPNTPKWWFTAKKIAWISICPPDDILGWEISMFGPGSNPHHFIYMSTTSSTSLSKAEWCVDCLWFMHQGESPRMRMRMCPLIWMLFVASDSEVLLFQDTCVLMRTLPACEDADAGFDAEPSKNKMTTQVSQHQIGS
jgi:hypothetical protein